MYRKRSVLFQLSVPVGSIAFLSAAAEVPQPAWVIWSGAKPGELFWTASSCETVSLPTHHGHERAERDERAQEHVVDLWLHPPTQELLWLQGDQVFRAWMDGTGSRALARLPAGFLAAGGSSALSPVSFGEIVGALFVSSASTGDVLVAALTILPPRYSSDIASWKLAFSEEPDAWTPSPRSPALYVHDGWLYWNTGRASIRRVRVDADLLAGNIVSREELIPLGLPGGADGGGIITAFVVTAKHFYWIRRQPINGSTVVLERVFAQTGTVAAIHTFAAGDEPVDLAYPHTDPVFASEMEERYLYWLIGSPEARARVQRLDLASSNVFAEDICLFAGLERRTDSTVRPAALAVYAMPEVCITIGCLYLQVFDECQTCGAEQCQTCFLDADDWVMKTWIPRVAKFSNCVWLFPPEEAQYYVRQNIRSAMDRGILPPDFETVIEGIPGAPVPLPTPLPTRPPTPPTRSPTARPTASPTPHPSLAPTASPTPVPPTPSPTTVAPTALPTLGPTSPTSAPTPDVAVSPTMASCADSVEMWCSAPDAGMNLTSLRPCGATWLYGLLCESGDARPSSACATEGAGSWWMTAGLGCVLAATVVCLVWSCTFWRRSRPSTLGKYTATAPVDVKDADAEALRNAAMAADSPKGSASVAGLPAGDSEGAGQSESLQHEECDECAMGLEPELQAPSEFSDSKDESHLCSGSPIRAKRPHFTAPSRLQFEEEQVDDDRQEALDEDQGNTEDGEAERADNVIPAVASAVAGRITHAMRKAMAVGISDEQRWQFVDDVEDALHAIGDALPEDVRDSAWAWHERHSSMLQQRRGITCARDETLAFIDDLREGAQLRLKSGLRQAESSALALALACAASAKHERESDFHGHADVGDGAALVPSLSLGEADLEHNFGAETARCAVVLERQLEDLNNKLQRLRQVDTAPLLRLGQLAEMRRRVAQLPAHVQDRGDGNSVVVGPQAQGGPDRWKRIVRYWRGVEQGLAAFHAGAESVEVALNKELSTCDETVTTSGTEPEELGSERLRRQQANLGVENHAQLGIIASRSGHSQAARARRMRSPFASLPDWSHVPQDDSFRSTTTGGSSSSTAPAPSVDSPSPRRQSPRGHASVRGAWGSSKVPFPRKANTMPQADTSGSKAPRRPAGDAPGARPADVLPPLPPGLAAAIKRVAAFQQRLGQVQAPCDELALERFMPEIAAGLTECEQALTDVTDPSASATCAEMEVDAWTQLLQLWRELKSVLKKVQGIGGAYRAGGAAMKQTILEQSIKATHTYPTCLSACEHDLDEDSSAGVTGVRNLTRQLLHADRHVFLQDKHLQSEPQRFGTLVHNLQQTPHQSDSPSAQGQALYARDTLSASHQNLGQAFEILNQFHHKLSRNFAWGDALVAQPCDAAHADVSSTHFEIHSDGPTVALDDAPHEIGSGSVRKGPAHGHRAEEARSAFFEITQCLARERKELEALQSRSCVQSADVVVEDVLLDGAPLGTQVGAVQSQSASASNVSAQPGTPGVRSSHAQSAVRGGLLEDVDVLRRLAAERSSLALFVMPRGDVEEALQSGSEASETHSDRSRWKNLWQQWRSLGIELAEMCGRTAARLASHIEASDGAESEPNVSIEALEHLRLLHRDLAEWYLGDADEVATLRGSDADARRELMRELQDGGRKRSENGDGVFGRSATAAPIAEHGQAVESAPSQAVLHDSQIALIDAARRLALEREQLERLRAALNDHAKATSGGVLDKAGMPDGDAASHMQKSTASAVESLGPLLDVATMLQRLAREHHGSANEFDDMEQVLCSGLNGSKSEPEEARWTELMGTWRASGQQLSEMSDEVARLAITAVDNSDGEVTKELLDAILSGVSSTRSLLDMLRDDDAEAQCERMRRLRERRTQRPAIGMLPTSGNDAAGNGQMTLVEAARRVALQRGEVERLRGLLHGAGAERGVADGNSDRARDQESSACGGVSAGEVLIGGCDLLSLGPLLEIASVLPHLVDEHEKFGPHEAFELGDNGQGMQRGLAESKTVAEKARWKELLAMWRASGQELSQMCDEADVAVRSVAGSADCALTSELLDSIVSSVSCARGRLETLLDDDAEAQSQRMRQLREQRRKRKNVCSDGPYVESKAAVECNPIGGMVAEHSAAVNPNGLNNLAASSLSASCSAAKLERLRNDLREVMSLSRRQSESPSDARTNVVQGGLRLTGRLKELQRVIDELMRERDARMKECAAACLASVSRGAAKSPSSWRQLNAIWNQIGTGLEAAHDEVASALGSASPPASVESAGRPTIRGHVDQDSVAAQWSARYNSGLQMQFQKMEKPAGGHDASIQVVANNLVSASLQASLFEERLTAVRQQLRAVASPHKQSDDRVQNDAAIDARGVKQAHMGKKVIGGLRLNGKLKELQRLIAQLMQERQSRLKECEQICRGLPSSHISQDRPAWEELRARWQRVENELESARAEVEEAVAAASGAPDLDADAADKIVQLDQSGAHHVRGFQKEHAASLASAQQLRAGDIPDCMSSNPDVDVLKRMVADTCALEGVALDHVEDLKRSAAAIDEALQTDDGELEHIEAWRQQVGLEELRRIARRKRDTKQSPNMSEIAAAQAKYQEMSGRFETLRDAEAEAQRERMRQLKERRKKRKENAPIFHDKENSDELVANLPTRTRDALETAQRLLDVGVGGDVVDSSVNDSLHGNMNFGKGGTEVMAKPLSVLDTARQELAAVSSSIQLPPDAPKQTSALEPQSAEAATAEGWAIPAPNDLANELTSALDGIQQRARLVAHFGADLLEELGELFAHAPQEVDRHRKNQISSKVVDVVERWRARLSDSAAARDSSSSEEGTQATALMQQMVEQATSMTREGASRSRASPFEDMDACRKALLASWENRLVELSGERNSQLSDQEQQMKEKILARKRKRKEAAPLARRTRTRPFPSPQTASQAEVRAVRLYAEDASRFVMTQVEDEAEQQARLCQRRAERRSRRLTTPSGSRSGLSKLLARQLSSASRPGTRESSGSCLSVDSGDLTRTNNSPAVARSLSSRSRSVRLCVDVEPP